MRLAVSNSGPLIHLAKAGLLHLIKLYDVAIPQEVKREVVDAGKEKGYTDAFLVEKAIDDGWIEVIEVEVDRKFSEIARLAGLHEAEIGVVYYAYRKKITGLLDDDPARVFARDLGVKVKGSLGLLIEGLKEGLMNYQEATEGLNKLADVMYLSSSVYRLVLKEIEKWK